MSMKDIRVKYGVPAKRGVRVIYTGNGKQELGTIICSDGPDLRIKLDGDSYAKYFHPTTELEYPETDGDA